MRLLALQLQCAAAGNKEVQAAFKAYASCSLSLLSLVEVLVQFSGAAQFKAAFLQAVPNPWVDAVSNKHKTNDQKQVQHKRLAGTQLANQLQQLERTRPPFGWGVNITAKCRMLAAAASKQLWGSAVEPFVAFKEQVLCTRVPRVTNCCCAGPCLLQAKLTDFTPCLSWDSIQLKIQQQPSLYESCIRPALSAVQEAVQASTGSPVDLSCSSPQQVLALLAQVQPPVPEVCVNLLRAVESEGRMGALLAASGQPDAPHRVCADPSGRLAGLPTTRRRLVSPTLRSLFKRH